MNLFAFRDRLIIYLLELTLLAHANSPIEILLKELYKCLILKKCRCFYFHKDIHQLSYSIPSLGIILNGVQKFASQFQKLFFLNFVE